MTIFLTNQTSKYDLAFGSEEIFLLDGVSIQSGTDGFDFDGFSSNVLFVDGTIASGLDGIVGTSLAQNNRVFISTSGSVFGASDGIEVRGSNFRLENHGELVGFGDAAFQTFGADSRNAELINFGSMTGLYDGVNFDGADSTIDNYGSISGVHAVSIDGDNIRIVNAGSLIGTGLSEGFTGGGYDVSAGIYIEAGANMTSVTNSGTISGVYSIFTQSGVDDWTATNSGLLDGDVQGSDGVQVTKNSGAILGDVMLGGGGDTFKAIGGGYVTGTVFGDGGQDLLRGGSLADTLAGGLDEDTLKGGGGDDVLSGGSEDDLIFGGKGDDEIVGDSGNDTLYGGGDDDTVLGDSGNDMLRGDTGDDSLNGGDDNDTLKGGHGDDTLDGGSGQDELLGGAGNDVLITAGKGDVLNGGRGDDTLTSGGGNDEFVFGIKAGDDVITDFSDGNDRIDLSAYNLKNFNALNSSGAISNLSGDGVIINLTLIGGVGSITLEGTLLVGDLSGADFIF